MSLLITDIWSRLCVPNILTHFLKSHLYNPRACNATKANSDEVKSKVHGELYNLSDSQSRVNIFQRRHMLRGTFFCEGLRHDYTVMGCSLEAIVPGVLKVFFATDWSMRWECLCLATVEQAGGTITEECSSFLCEWNVKSWEQVAASVLRILRHCTSTL